MTSSLVWRAPAVLVLVALALAPVAVLVALAPAAVLVALAPVAVVASSLV